MTIRDRIIEVMDKQIDKGITKYGATLDNNELTSRELINHAIEEATDLLFYLMALKDKV